MVGHDHLVGCLMISYGVGTEEGLRFNARFLGDTPRLLQSLMFLKMVARPFIVRNNFQDGFGHCTDENTPFKRRKQMGKL